MVCVPTCPLCPHPLVCAWPDLPGPFPCPLLHYICLGLPTLPSPSSVSPTSLLSFTAPFCPSSHLSHFSLIHIFHRPLPPYILWRNLPLRWHMCWHVSCMHQHMYHSLAYLGWQHTHTCFLNKTEKAGHGMHAPMHTCLPAATPFLLTTMLLGREEGTGGHRHAVNMCCCFPPNANNSSRQH